MDIDQSFNTVKVNRGMFATNLFHLMKEKGYSTSEELAAALNVAKHQVDHWLEADCFPKHETMVKIMIHFGFTNYIALVSSDIRKVANNPVA